MNNNDIEEDLLNDSEKIIVEMIRHDCDVKDIADKLNISVHTVKSHISKLERMNIID
ncbi:MAG: winged helix-turn-helix transcriptional regulator [Brachyspira sp.]|nr:winged helix-turn-helix transcriptional regulator [Brachyspira sp.]